jgi:hypothetical protein
MSTEHTAAVTALTSQLKSEHALKMEEMSTEHTAAITALTSQLKSEALKMEEMSTEHTAAIAALTSELKSEPEMLRLEVEQLQQNVELSDNLAALNLSCDAAAQRLVELQKETDRVHPAMAAAEAAAEEGGAAVEASPSFSPHPGGRAGKNSWFVWLFFLLSMLVLYLAADPSSSIPVPFLCDLLKRARSSTSHPVT